MLDKQFQALGQEYRELPNGYSFRLPNDIETIKGIAEWVNLERLCCPFFSFDLVSEREGGAFWLNITDAMV